jgi:hypothetical protein
VSKALVQDLFVERSYSMAFDQATLLLRKQLKGEGLLERYCGPDERVRHLYLLFLVLSTVAGNFK